MSEITEGLGGAIEGALTARAVEKQAGEGFASPGGTCLNCGTELLGPHCHACGQKAQVHRTISAILHDIVHGVLHLDGKLWRTLPLLAFKPGELTRRYIDGERARFVSPMAMFLFSVFLMFAVFQAVGLTTPSDVKPDISTGDAVSQVQGSALAQLKDARQRAETYPEGSPERLQAEADIANAEKFFNQLDENQKFMLGTDALAEGDGTGIGPVDAILEKWRDNPGLMLYKLQTNAYKFSWLLIPLSVPFLWLMFAWKRHIRAYDHAIFVTYSIAFMSLLFIALSLLSLSGVAEGWVFGALAIIPPLHIYKDLRKAYGLSRFSAFWRLCLLLVFITVVIMLFLQILLLLGAT
ncbi:DUF3667 domain-containing protein [Altererythrobacter sp. Z27]|uniref:DUF3667 domain-containing protein n=1 Tax=Altererythrobacter sp. Z27 TaxID=3461147 RepID=UPI0040447F7F